MRNINHEPEMVEVEQALVRLGYRCAAGRIATLSKPSILAPEPQDEWWIATRATDAACPDGPENFTVYGYAVVDWRAASILFRETRVYALGARP